MTGATGSWTWSDHRVVAERPTPGDNYLLLPGMPFGVLLSWYAGPSHVVRCTDLVPRHDTSHEVHDHDGRVRRWTEPWDDTKEADLDDEYDEWLAEHDLPPRPRWTDWYLHAPGVSEVMPLFHATERAMRWPMSAEASVRFLVRTAELVHERFEPVAPDVGRASGPSGPPP